MKTLSDILIEVNSYLDLTAELPSGDDLTVRTNFANQAVDEWAASYRFRQLKETTDYFATAATVPLNGSFKELLAPPVSGTTEYREVQMEERHGLSGDTFCYIRGNQVSGYNMIVSGLPSEGATLSIDWLRYPSHMATLTSVCEVPDTDFVKLKVISQVLQSRLDERFPTVEAEAKRILNNMIGREMTLSPGGDRSARKYGSALWGIGRRNG